MGRYFAVVCKRGHVYTATLRTPNEAAGWRSSGDVLFVDEPSFCGTCSAPMMRACESCDAPIPGFEEDVIDFAFELAPFCERCGSAFPWATREERVGQLYNLLDFEEIGEADRLRVAEALAVLSTPDDEADGDAMVRAGETFRRLAPKAWDAAQPVLTGVLSSWLRKRLGLP